MFSATYKFAMNNDKGTIKLTPTSSTWAKAFMPSLVIGAVTAVWYYHVDRELKKAESTIINLNEN